MSIAIIIAIIVISALREGKDFNDVTLTSEDGTNI